MLGDEGQVLARSEALETQDVNLVIGADLVVIGRVGEGQGEHTLLLQVGLVDTSERADNDGETTKEAGFESSVLARGALTIVVVTNDDPLDAVIAVVSSSLWDTTVLAGNLVLDLVGLTIFSVDGADKAVLGDVLEVSTVLQPGSTSRNMVCRALALDLNEDREVCGGLAIPGLEGLEELKAVGLRINGNLDVGTVFRGRLEGILSRVVAAGRKLMAVGIGELERLAISTNELVGQGIEGQAASEGESSDNVGGSDESVSSGISIVTTGEVAVVRGDDWDPR